MSDTENERSAGATGKTNRPAATENASAEDWLGSNQDPDVLLSVPDLGVDKITLSVKDLVADIDLQARVLDLLDLRVGAHVALGSVELEIENVRAQAMLKVKLDKVAEIIDRVMTTIDNNPEILTSLTAPIGRGVEEMGQGVGEGVRELADRPSGGTRAIETAQHVQYDEPGKVNTVYADGRWWNKVEGTDTVRGPYDTEEAAVKEASDAARSGRVNPVTAADSANTDEPTRAAAERAIDPST